MTISASLPAAYHAHVYFDAATRDGAKDLRELISQTFPAVKIGRFHEKNVGPHPRWSFQVLFGKELFDEIVPWLMVNREGLTVFLHPLIDDAYAAHADHAMWMGEMLPLDLEVLKG